MKTKFKIRGYSGAVIDSPWWGRMVLDIEGMTVSQPLPILREHDRLRASGVGEQIHKDTAALVVEGFLLSNRDGAEIAELLQGGFPLQASVGVFAQTIEKVTEGETVSVNGSAFTGPGVVWRKSHVREISICVLGADSQTRTDIAASAPAFSGTQPKDFAEALSHVMAQGVEVQAAIRTAATRYPKLYEAYCASYTNELSDVQGQEAPDVEASRLAMTLAEKEGISYAQALNEVFKNNPALAERYFTDDSELV